jgi:predicted nucleic acid-binding Zn ribbon protein
MRAMSSSLLPSTRARSKNNRIPVVFTKTCQICGKKFKTRANNAKHCSQECRLEARRKRRFASLGPTKTILRLCEKCGKSFETKTTYQKFCSDKCYRLATAERKRVERKKRREVIIQINEDVFLGLCSVCGADDAQVSECRDCGFLSCEDCLNDSGFCRICSEEHKRVSSLV